MSLRSAESIAHARHLFFKPTLDNGGMKHMLCPAVPHEDNLSSELSNFDSGCISWLDGTRIYVQLNHGSDQLNILATTRLYD